MTLVEALALCCAAFGGLFVWLGWPDLRAAACAEALLERLRWPALGGILLLWALALALAAVLTGAAP
jgi:hypothetical protein